MFIRLPYVSLSCSLGSFRILFFSYYYHWRWCQDVWFSEICICIAFPRITFVAVSISCYHYHFPLVYYRWGFYCLKCLYYLFIVLLQLTWCHLSCQSSSSLPILIFYPIWRFLIQGVSIGYFLLPASWFIVGLPFNRCMFRFHDFCWLLFP